jgi:structural maintenance of chromosome 1
MRAELEKMVPNMKAVDRLADVEQGLNEAHAEEEEARKENKAAKDRFQDLRKKR